MMMKRMNINLALLIIITTTIIIVFTWIQSYVTSLSVTANLKDGYIDLQQEGFDENKLLILNGNWEFYWKQLLTPDDFRTNKQLIPQYLSLPNELTDKNYSADGYATLRLHIKIKDINQVYGLKLNYFSSANKIWINGRMVGSSGKVADNKADFKPEYRPIEVFFRSSAQDVDIDIQIANFHHRRMVLKEVYFGTAEQITSNTYHNLIKEAVFIGNLLMIALYYGVLYFIQNKEKAALSLSAVSLLAAVRESIIGNRILVRMFPTIPAEWLMKLGFLPVFLLLPLFVLYIKEIFHTDKFNGLLKISNFFSLITTIILFLTNIKVYDAMFTYALGIVLVLAGYGIYIIITNRFIHETKGSLLMAIGVMIVILGAFNDYLRELNFIHSPELLSVSIVVFVVMQATFLAWRIRESIDETVNLAIENEKMVLEIKNLNMELENRILKRTKELEIANVKLKKLSMTDPLTGVMNRRYFEMRMKQEWEEAFEKKVPISIIMVDIDYFKGYNDTYGHMEGDQCLRKISYALSISIRPGVDVIARYGGEEFVALLPDADAATAHKIAESMRENVLQLKILHEKSYVDSFVTISAGVHTQLPLTNKNYEKCIDEADKALYSAKDCGRNRVMVSRQVI